jgi:hypothetical protein
MVGRVAERMALAARLQVLLGGQGGAATVEGEAGLGKSRLVEDLVEQARAIQLEALVGGGDAIENHTPYYAWRPIFSQLLDVDLLRDSGVRRNTLLSLGLEVKQLQLLPLLNAVLPFELPDNDMTGQMTGQVRADNTRNFLLHLLNAAAGQSPKLIVLEDGQWLDTPSWALALSVAQQVRSVLLVIATRPFPESLHPEYGQLLRLPGVERLRLSALSPEDTVAFVCQQLDVNAVPAPVAALIRAKAEGNPFYSEELAYALRDSGLITVADGECRLAGEAADFARVKLPDTVEGVITSRIDRLAPAQALTLKAASVIGRAFPFRTLHDIYPVELDKDQLGQHLETLAQLDLTERETPEPNLSYLFKHIITRDVAYNLMLFAQRRRLHQSVAEWYETHHAADLPLFYELLAHHWRTAEAPDKALAYLEKAASQALENYANEEAIGFYEEALELDSQQAADSGRTAARNARRARWELRLGEAYANAARHREGRAHLERGLALLGQPTPAGQLQTGLRLLGQLGRQVLHRLFPNQFIGRRAAERETLLEAARTYERLTEVYYFANETLLALFAAIGALNLAEAAGPSPELARAYAPVGTILGFIPLHGLAQAYCRRALETVRPMNNLAARAWVSLVTGVYYAGLGQWAMARGLFDEVVSISDRLGDRRRWDDGVTNLVMVYYFEAEFTRAAQLADDFYASAARRGDVDNQAWAVTEKGNCALALGDLGAASDCAERLQGLLAEHTGTIDEPLKIAAYGLLALVRWRQGRPQPAQELAQQALQLITRSSPSAYTALLGYAAVAEVFINLWQDTEVSAAAEYPKLAARACQALHQFANVFPIGGPRAWLWQGHYERLAGNRGRALQAWQKSLRAARKMLMPYGVGLAHAELALNASPGDPQRASHREQAQALFTQLGARDDLKRLNEIREHV